MDNWDDTDPDDDLLADDDDARKRKRNGTPERKKRMRGDSNAKSEHRDQRYRKEWESDSRFRAWIAPVKGKATRALCKCCDKEMNAEISVMKRHAASAGHLKNNKAIGAESGQKTLFQCALKDPAVVKLETQIKEAEIRKCAFLAQNNIAIRAVESMVATDKKCYPDSKIAQGMRLGRTKATKVITNVIGQCHQAELAEKLRAAKFSVIIDESTDIGTIKSMAVCVRFLDGEKVVSKFWKLVQVFSGKHTEAANEGATARRLFHLLIKSFTDENVPLENLIGFASDGCNTMFGVNNSVSSRLKETFEGITVQKCLCHSLHICASEACKELPRCIEDLARDIYGVFKNSCKRQAELGEFQEFHNTDPHKILRPAQTRWLSLQSVVNRILEQWDPVKGYFHLKSFDERLIAATNIVTFMNDPTTKQYYHFLQWALPKFVDLNELFQSDRALVTIVYKKMATAYKDLLLAFMDRSYVERTPLEEIDPADSSKFIPLQNMYLGVKVMKAFSEPPILNHPDRVNMEKGFRERCRAFLVKGCCELRQRFDFRSDSPFAKMACLTPSEVLGRQKEPSLLQLIETVPRICDPNNLDRVQQLDDQWRLLEQREFAKGMQDLEVDAFWAAIRDYTDLDGKKIFQELGCFALEVLSLPHSNAVCERCFSKINLIKTKIRNRMMTETLNGLLLASQCAKDGGGCDKFPVTPAMIAAMNVENLKPKKKPATRESRGVADLDVAFDDGEEEMVEEVIDDGDYEVVFGD